MITQFIRTIFNTTTTTNKGVKGAMGHIELLQVRAGELAELEKGFKFLVEMYHELKTTAALTDWGGCPAAYMLFGMMAAYAPQSLLLSPAAAWDAARYFVEAVRIDCHGRRVDLNGGTLV